MRAYDLVELAGRNLREAVLRNSLTTLGISVGVASLVAMLSLGVGLQRLATRQLGRSGLFDSIFVTSRQLRGRVGFSQNQPATPYAAPKTLDDAARKQFEALPEVVEVYPNLSAAVELRLDNGGAADGHFTVMGGLPESARGSEAFDDVQGKFFSSGNAPEVIVHSEFARRLLGLPEKDPPSDQKLTQEEANQLLNKDVIMRYSERQAGQIAPAPSGSAKGDADSADDEDANGFSVVRREQRLKIVGIVNSESYRGMRQGRTAVFLPVEFAESLNMMQAADMAGVIRPGQGKTYAALVVRVKKSKNVSNVEDQIKQLGFNTFSIVDASKGITRFFRILDTFLAVFGSLALAVATLGIVNTLVMAILERRREIGIMKAIGASDGDVERIFSMEAISMGAVGGLFGVALGWVIGRTINFATNIYLQRQDVRPESYWYVPLWLVIAGILFSIAVSWAAGRYPASRAARLDPVQALRHD